jgi:hypothetical protein
MYKSLFGWVGQAAAEAPAEKPDAASLSAIENLNHLLSGLAIHSNKLARAKHCFRQWVEGNNTAVSLVSLINVSLLKEIPDEIWDEFRESVAVDEALRLAFDPLNQARDTEIRLDEWSSIDPSEAVDGSLPSTLP